MVPRLCGRESPRILRQLSWHRYQTFNSQATPSRLLDAWEWTHEEEEESFGLFSVSRTQICEGCPEVRNRALSTGICSDPILCVDTRCEYMQYNIPIDVTHSWTAVAYEDYTIHFLYFPLFSQEFFSGFYWILFIHRFNYPYQWILPPTILHLPIQRHFSSIAFHRQVKCQLKGRSFPVFRLLRSSGTDRTSIGSRPSKRKPSGRIESLRTMPWIFAWTRIRSLLPVWLGFEAAFRHVIDEGHEKPPHIHGLSFRSMPVQIPRTVITLVISGLSPSIRNLCFWRCRPLKRQKLRREERDRFPLTGPGRPDPNVWLNPPPRFLKLRPNSIFSHRWTLRVLRRVFEKLRRDGSLDKAEANPAVRSVVFVAVLDSWVLQDGQAEETRLRERGKQILGMVHSAVCVRTAQVHERHFEHHPRLRRGLQLLGAAPLSSLQVGVSDVGVQVQEEPYSFHHPRQ